MGRPHDVRPGGAGCGRHNGRVADQCAGVGARGTRARLGGTHRQEHHRLAGAGGRVDEGAAVAEVLGVDGDHLGECVIGEGGHQLGHVDVGLVSDRGKAREPEPDLPRQDAELEGEVAALGGEADRPRRELVGGQAEVGARVVHAQAVRPEQHRTGRAHPLHQRPLAQLRLGAQLAQARGDADQRPRAGGERVVHGLLEGRRRDGDDDQLGNAGQLCERGVRRPAEDGAALSVDQVDRPPVLTLERAAPEPVAPLGGVVGGSDDGDRTGVEERAKVTYHGAVCCQRSRMAAAAARPVRTAPSM